MKSFILILVIFIGVAEIRISNADGSLPPLKGGIAPQTFAELWAGYDPRTEPLDVEILKEWEEDGVVIRVVRYCIGTFKGQKAMMAAVYGFPKDGANLPGLLNIHGGGQYADANAVFKDWYTLFAAFPVGAARAIRGFVI